MNRDISKCTLPKRNVHSPSLYKTKPDISQVTSSCWATQSNPSSGSSQSAHQTAVENSQPDPDNSSPSTSDRFTELWTEKINYTPYLSDLSLVLNSTPRQFLLYPRCQTAATKIIRPPVSQHQARLFLDGV